MQRPLVLADPNDPLGSLNALPETGTTSFTYDLQGRLTSKTDAEGRTTTVDYDVLGRVSRVTDPLGRRTHYRYDEVGNLIEVENGAGEVVQYEYDNRGLLTRQHDPAGTFDDSFAYDVLGRQVLAENATTTSTIAYDALDRATALYDGRFGTARRVFDADGRVRQIVYPDNGTAGFPSGVVVNYNYDPRGLLSGIRDPVAGRWSFEYDGAGRPLRQIDPSGIYRSTSYTPRGFVDEVRVVAPSGVLETIDYQGYDKVGNPGTITTGEGNTQITYDALDRVIHAGYPVGSEDFGYDKVGNRTSHKRLSGQHVLYDVDAGDQIIAIRDPNLPQPLEEFTYDGAGRRWTHDVGGTTTTYSYDARNRLTGISAPGSSTTLAYDALGSRYRRTENGQDAFYLGEWTGDRGGEKIRLVHGPGIDRVLAEISGTERRHLIPNAAFNVVRVYTDDGTGAHDVRRYEAFGAVRSASGSIPVEPGFAGRPVEGSSGLVYVRARHYDPATGQFLQPDPLGIEVSELYAYASSNPYRRRDPLGLRPVSISQRTIDLALSQSAQPGRVGGTSVVFDPEQFGTQAERLAGVVESFGRRFGSGVPEESVVRIELDPRIGGYGNYDFRHGTILLHPDVFGDDSLLRSTFGHEFQHHLDVLREAGAELPGGAQRRLLEMRAFGWELRNRDWTGLKGRQLRRVIERYQDFGGR